MEFIVLSDFVSDRLALLQAARERGEPMSFRTSASAMGPEANGADAARASEPSEEERILRSGRDGEQLVIEHIREQLGEPASILSGYQTPAGEIDIVVVAPGNVTAIEVKSLNAEIRVNGDTWSRWRGGTDGQALSEWSPIVDEGGRSPSLQLNSAADHLQLLLNQSGLNFRLQRWVVLAHPKSLVTEVKDLTVDRVLHVMELQAGSMSAPTPDWAADKLAVERMRVLICRDHRASERRRASRPDAGTRGRVPPVQGWPKAERMERLLSLARTAARVGVGAAEVEALRAVIRHDLLVRREPWEVPALISELREEPGAELLCRLTEEISQVFEEPDRCLVALCLPVGVRLRKFLNHDLTRLVANENILSSIGHLLRLDHGMRRVCFDPRLYSTDALQGVGPQSMHRFLLDLESRGPAAEPAAETMRLVAVRDGDWQIVNLLGVGVLDAAACVNARAWTRLQLPTGQAWRLTAGLGGFDPRYVAPGVMHEASSIGVFMLHEGLRRGVSALARLRTGAQGAAHESIFMAPLRLGL